MEFFLKVYAWIMSNWKLILSLAPFGLLIIMYAGLVPTLTRGYYRLKEALRLVFTTRAGFVIGIIVLLIWAYFNFWYTKLIPD